jgi:hypothetical protein
MTWNNFAIIASYKVASSYGITGQVRYFPAANGIEFVDVQFANFVIELGHVVPLFVLRLGAFPRAC